MTQRADDATDALGPIAKWCPDPGVPDGMKWWNGKGWGAPEKSDRWDSVGRIVADRFVRTQTGKWSYVVTDRAGAVVAEVERREVQTPLARYQRGRLGAWRNVVTGEKVIPSDCSGSTWSHGGQTFLLFKYRRRGARTVIEVCDADKHVILIVRWVPAGDRVPERWFGPFSDGEALYWGDLPVPDPGLFVNQVFDILRGRRSLGWLLKQVALVVALCLSDG